MKERKLPIKIDLPQGFLDEEVRCGYTITPKLKKIWAVELDLLAELQRVCKKYNLRFHGAYGTMIGAVRHKGFIPWDDDMDVWMPRKDYDKLAEVAEEEFAHPYFFQCPKTDPENSYSFNRLRNSETTAVIKGTKSPIYNCGIYIDIFPLDEAPATKIGDSIQKALVKLLTMAIIVNRGNNQGRSLASRILTPIFSLPVKLVPIAVWLKMYRRVMTCCYNDQGLYAALFSPKPHVRNQRIPGSLFDNPMQSPYEFMTMPIPQDYDRILSEYYGKYMEFPPPKERGAWHENMIRFDPDVSYHEWFRSHPEGF